VYSGSLIVQQGFFFSGKIKIVERSRKMSKKSKKQLSDWAHFRFSVIGALLARPPDKGDLRKEIEKLARRLYPAILGEVAG
jgi:hypothetical protein